MRLFWLLLGCLIGGSIAVPIRAAAHQKEPIVYYDMTGLFALDLNDPAQRRRFWDETHLIVSLQGLVNRDAPRLFLRYLKDPDDFWWKEMTQPGGWMAGRKVERVARLDALLERFRAFYRGAVVWDERVPATSNLASTLAGCENLLCLRYDPSPASLYRLLTSGKLSIKKQLLRENGAPLFTGAGTIPGTALASTGSAKADAYLWLIENYVRTGRANPLRMGYYLDGFWLRSWQAGSPENHTLTNQDFVIAHKGVLFDLNVWDDEACVDDPEQKPGTDAAVLRQLLRAAYDRFRGEGFIHVAGFVPWAYKYTKFRGATWSAGGKHAEVPTEWRYAEILSCYNAYMDADALGLSAMSNASFYRHYPLKPRYPQNPKPTRDSLIARGILDAQGKIVPRRYIAHYVGDYDAAAWLYRMLPRLWQDPARGTTPLSWAFNPNLAERFPFGMAWAREKRTSNDWFVAGDSGAGYLNPGFLTPPRTYSGLPSGLTAWEKHCLRFYRQWDLSLTGFVIDGFAPGLSPEGWDAYARFSPDGIVGQKIPHQGVHKGMPFVQMRSDLSGSPGEAAQRIYEMSSGPLPRFQAFRSILQTPTWYADLERELQRLGGEEVRVVDLPTLLWLVREYETKRAGKPEASFAKATLVQATPARQEGLSAVHNEDGPVRIVTQEGAKYWQVPAHQPPYCLYFDVAETFFRAGSSTLEVELEYLDRGQGRIVLEYDSTRKDAPLEGAYTRHPLVIERADSGQWRKAIWRLDEARLGGRQNGGADLRFYCAGDALLARAARVRRLSPTR
jgi:hypothetical protein